MRPRQAGGLFLSLPPTPEPARREENVAMDPDSQDSGTSLAADQLTDGESGEDSWESWWSRQELPGVEVRLLDQETWRQFSQVATEMIVTKPGRRIFPEVKVLVSGLDGGAQYVVGLGARPVSGRRFRFQQGRWAAWGRADPPRRPPHSNLFLHADSPADGRHWSHAAVSLYAAKLTNDPASTAPHGAQILVSSMHKYVPVVHIFKTSSLLNLETCPKASFSFPEAEFIAVTAYQNDDLAALKIRNNPFAKAFRNKLTRRRSNVDVTKVSSVTKKTTSQATSVPPVASPLVEAIVRPVPVFHWPVCSGLPLEYLRQSSSYYQNSFNIPSYLYPRLSYNICGCICDHKHFDPISKDILL